MPTPKLPQHEIVIEVSGVRVVGHYTLRRVGRRDRLTVWFRGRCAVDPEIAPEAEPSSTEVVAREMLRCLADEVSDTEPG